MIGEKISTVKRLKELLKNEELSVVLRDSGGFLWWKDYYDGIWVYIGCATPARLNDYGIASRAWINIFIPGITLKKYGPFTVIDERLG